MAWRRSCDNEHVPFEGRKKSKGSFADAIVPPTLTIRRTKRDVTPTVDQYQMVKMEDESPESSGSDESSPEESNQEKLDRAQSVLDRLFSTTPQQQRSQDSPSKAKNGKPAKKSKQHKRKFPDEESQTEDDNASGRLPKKRGRPKVKMLSKKENKRGKNSSFDEDSPVEKTKKSRKPRKATAYNVWSKGIRSKLLQENPEMDFATVSKTVGEMWSHMSQTDKMFWERKARKSNSSGSMLISTGKKATMKKTGGQQSVARKVPVRYGSPRAEVEPRQERPVVVSPRSTFKLVSTAPIDLAAYLRLTGESAVNIGERLKDLYKQNVSVQGTTSVLLDSLLCVLVPLTCLADTLPPLQHPLSETDKSIMLDNIGFIVPGVS